MTPATSRVSPHQGTRPEATPPAPVAQWIEQAPSKRLAAGSSPAGGASLRPPAWEGFSQLRAAVSGYDEAPDALLMIKGRVRGCPAVTGFSRVAVSKFSAGDQPAPGSSGRSPAASSHRCVDQQFAPLVVSVGFRQGHVLHPHGYGFLGPGAAVVQRGEEGVEPLTAARPAPDPVEDGRRLLGIQQGPLVHGVGGLRDRSRLLALGRRIGPKDAPPDRLLRGHVEEPAVALPGPGRRLLAVETGVDGVQDLVDLLRVLPGLPVGVRRGIRAPGRLTHPPSWLTVGG